VTGIEPAFSAVLVDGVANQAVVDAIRTFLGEPRLGRGLPVSRLLLKVGAAGVDPRDGSGS